MDTQCILESVFFLLAFARNFINTYCITYHAPDVYLLCISKTNASKSLIHSALYRMARHSHISQYLYLFIQLALSILKHLF
jgi:hypothetical protein